MQAASQQHEMAPGAWCWVESLGCEVWMVKGKGKGKGKDSKGGYAAGGTAG